MSRIDVINKLEVFLRDNNWTKESVGLLEVYLDDMLSKTPAFPIEDLRIDLASYSPGGGEFLFDENQMQKAIQACLLQLKQEVSL